MNRHSLSKSNKDNQYSLDGLITWNTRTPKLFSIMLWPAHKVFLIQRSLVIHKCSYGYITTISSYMTKYLLTAKLFSSILNLELTLHKLKYHLLDVCPIDNNSILNHWPNSHDLQRNNKVNDKSNHLGTLHMHANHDTMFSDKSSAIQTAKISHQKTHHCMSFPCLEWKLLLVLCLCVKLRNGICGCAKWSIQGSLNFIKSCILRLPLLRHSSQCSLPVKQQSHARNDVC